MKKETIRCSECKYCGFLSSLRGTRNTFHCGHPDGSYINRYFMEHGIRKAPGFLGFGKPYSRKVPLKTSPAWCPLKQEKEGIHCERYLTKYAVVVLPFVPVTPIIFMLSAGLPK